ncbi:MAG: O-antigen ligase family protein [Acidimicrobiia bacterium]
MSLTVGAVAVALTAMVAFNVSGHPTYRASSSFFLTLDAPLVVDDAVDRLESADTSDAVGMLVQVLSSPDLHLRAMGNVGIDSEEADEFEVTVTTPGDALMATVEVSGPGLEVVDVAEEIGRQASGLVEDSIPYLALEVRAPSFPSATNDLTAIQPLVTMAIGFLAVAVMVGGALVEYRGVKAIAGTLKAALRDWMEGRAIISARRRSGPWPDARLPVAVVLVLIAVVYYAPGHAIWPALGAAVGLSMLLALRYPQLLAIGFVVLVLFNLSDIGTDFFGLPGFAVPYTLFAIGALATRKWVLDEDRRGWIGLAVAFAALVAVMSISGITADDQALAFEWTVDLVKNGLVAVLMVVLIRDLDDLRRVVWTLIVGTSLLALLGIIRSATGDIPGLLEGFSQVVTEVADEEVVGVRIAGPLGDANFFGQLLVVVFPFALERAFRERSRLPMLIAIAATLLIGSAVVLTYSRGALIGIFVATVVALAWIRPAPRKVLVALFVSALVLISTPGQYFERIGTIGQFLQIGSGSGLEDASFQGRTSEMLVGLEMFHDHPLSGVGPGNYPGRYVEYSSALGLDYRLELRQPHSLPIEVAAELGILGLAWWSVAGYILVSRLLGAGRVAMASHNSEMRHYLETLFFSFAGFAATALFLHLAYARSFWMMVGIAVAAIRMMYAQTGLTTPVAEYQAT